MSPLPEHERFNRAIQLLVPVIAEECGMEVYSLGSTTFNRADLQRGFEPDSCFYVQHATHVRGKDRIDLQVDPPPDLVVEIDITHPSIEQPSPVRIQANPVRALYTDLNRTAECRDQD